MDTEISSNFSKILEDTIAKQGKRAVFATCFNSEKRKITSVSDSIDIKAAQIILDPFHRNIKDWKVKQNEQNKGQSGCWESKEMTTFTEYPETNSLDSITELQN